MLRRQSLFNICAVFLNMMAATAFAGQLQPASCSCASGRGLKADMVSYLQRGDRLRIIDITRDQRTNQCLRMEIDRAELFPIGDPEKGFYVERRTSRMTESDPCSPKTARFVDRNSSYRFEFKKDSFTIQKIEPEGSVSAAPSVNSKSGASNSNLWDSIVNTLLSGKVDKLAIDPTSPYNRRSWVIAAKPIQAYTVGVAKDSVNGTRVVRVKRKQVRGGLLGQIEVVGDEFALVRFYKRSLNERYGIMKVVAHWYDGLGTDVEAKETDLYTAANADIVEVPLSSIMELNDYFDQLHIDATARPANKFN